MFGKALRRFRSVIAKWLLDPSMMSQLMQSIELRNSIIYKAATLVVTDIVEGDYLEFGTYIGVSFATAYAALQEAFDKACIVNEWNSERDAATRGRLWNQMRFFAFDSFQGLPLPIGNDATSKVFVQGKYFCSQGDFERNISRWGVPLDRVKTVPGWFEDTLNASIIQEHNLKSAAIVHVDSDLYESAKLVLNFVTPLLVEGTIIIFDDWYSFKANPNLGEQRACKEWIESHPEWSLTEYQKEGPFRMSFVAHKRAF